MSDITIATLRQTILARSDRAAAMRAYMVTSNPVLLVAMLLAPTAIGAYGVPAVVIACGAIIAMLGLTGLLRLARAVPQPVTT